MRVRRVAAGVILGLSLGCAPRPSHGPALSWTVLQQDLRFPPRFRGQGVGLYRAGERTWKLRFTVQWDPDTLRWLVRGWMGVARQGKLPWTALLPGGTPAQPVPPGWAPRHLNRVGTETEATLAVAGHPLTLRFSSAGKLVAVRLAEGEMRILDRVEGPEGWVPRRVHWVSATDEFTGELQTWAWSAH